MNWFKHDTNASTDAKIKKLLLKYGSEGYAIYFHCLELIAGEISDNNITFELEHDAEIIADNLKIKGDSNTAAIDKVNQIMKYIIELGLFENNNGIITCMKLAKRLDQSMTSNSKFRKFIGRIKENHDVVMIDHDKSCKIRRDKIRKEEEGDKSSPTTKKFIKPTIEEIQQYLNSEQITSFTGNQFFHFYESKGWKIGNSPMKSWKSSVRTWVNRHTVEGKGKTLEELYGPRKTTK